jgi:hypothetical protein
MASAPKVPKSKSGSFPFYLLILVANEQPLRAPGADWPNYGLTTMLSSSSSAMCSYPAIPN